MSTFQQVGLGFTIFLVLFMAMAFFKEKDLTEGQSAILRFLTALCAGFAAALFTGEAAVSITANAPIQITISATAGFGAFFVIWFTYRVAFPWAISYAVPEGWTFREAATKLAQDIFEAQVSFEGFTPSQLDTRLAPRQIQAKTPESALNQLGSLSDTLPTYTVDQAAPTRFLFKVVS